MSICGLSLHLFRIEDAPRARQPVLPLGSGGLQRAEESPECAPGTSTSHFSLECPTHAPAKTHPVTLQRSDVVWLTPSSVARASPSI